MLHIGVTFVTSKTVRIDDDVEKVLRKYSDGSINDCVLAMDTKITSLADVIEGMKAVSHKDDPVSFAVPEMVDGMPSQYWKRFKKEIDEVLERARRGY